MTLFRQGRSSPKSSKALKLPSQPGTTETGAPEQSSSSAPTSAAGELSSLTGRQQIASRGYSISSSSSDDSATSSSGASSLYAINGPVGLQGVMNAVAPQTTSTHVSQSSARTQAPPPTSLSSHRVSPNPSQRPPIVEPSPAEGGNDTQVSRFGRLLPSTLEFRAHGATMPCLAYGTPRPPMSSEDYGSPPSYETIFGKPQTHDAVFRVQNARSTAA